MLVQILAAAAGAAASHAPPPAPPATTHSAGFVAYGSVALFGLAIGTSEMISRYKDAPTEAMLTRAALVYVALNGAASLSALWLIQAMGWLNALDKDATRNLILQCLIAGFGAMAFFRTSLFTVRVANADIAVGPAGFLQVILAAADRATDRARAKPRASSVAEIMNNISFAKAQVALPSLCFGLMQNVSADEQRSFGLVVKDLQAANMQDVIKANNLGLALINIVGEDVLRQAVAVLRRLISDPPKQVLQSVETLQLVKGLDYTEANAAQIIDECLLVSGQSQATGYRASLIGQTKIISAMKLGSVQKTLLLSALVISEFSEEILLAVIRSMQTPPAAARPGDPPPPDPGATSRAAAAVAQAIGVTPAKATPKTASSAQVKTGRAPAQAAPAPHTPAAAPPAVPDPPAVAASDVAPPAVAGTHPQEHTPAPEPIKQLPEAPAG